MFKRIFIPVFILCAVTLVAMSPRHVSAAIENAPKLQTTVEVTVAVSTSAPESTPSVIFVNNQTPTSTLVIFSLLAILGLAVVIGGVALFNRRQP